MLQVAAARVERWRDLIARCSHGSGSVPTTDLLADFEIELLRLTEGQTPAKILRDRLKYVLGELKDTQNELEDAQAELKDTQAELKDTQGELRVARRGQTVTPRALSICEPDSRLCQCKDCAYSGDVLVSATSRLVVLCHRHRLELDGDPDVAAFNHRLEVETYVLNAMTQIAGEQREFQGLRKQVQTVQGLREQAFACVVNWMNSAVRAET